MGTLTLAEYRPRISAKDKERFCRMNRLEEDFRREGFLRIAGLDEAGRGPLAGPVAAAACILDPDQPILGLNDSKKIGEKRREWLALEIKDKALAWQVALVSPERIDQVNILEASKEAMTQAVEELKIPPDLLLIDALFLPQVPLPQRSLVRGDSLANCIAAASILAKTERDRVMRDYDRLYPGYGLAHNKGYGTKEHYQAIEERGILPIHRLSFLKKLKAGQSQTSTRSQGFEAEKAVARHLQKQGFLILEQNFLLAPFGEIDLIARKKDRLYMIEVKARKEGLDQALEAIGPQKISRMRILGQYYADSRKLKDLPIILLGAACQLDSEGRVQKIRYTDLA